jgi:hypothetical protein
MTKVMKVASYMALGALYSAPMMGVDKQVCVMCGSALYGLIAGLCCCK